MLDFSMATEREIRADLGRRLRAQRLAQGLSQADLAKRAAIGLATVQRIERSGESTLENFVRAVMGLGLADELQSLFAIKIRSIAQLERTEKAKRVRAPRKISTTRDETGIAPVQAT